MLADNPPPKEYDWPPYLEHDRDDIDREVSAQLGHTPTNTWATTRAAALRQLETFVANIERVTAGDIKAAFARRVDPDRMVTVVVGAGHDQTAAAPAAASR